MNRQGPELQIVGLMSGTSADGIDAALVSIRIDGDRFDADLRRSLTVPFASADRESILRLQECKATVSDVAVGNVRLGRMLGEAACAVVGEKPPDAIGSHGQTIAHLPHAHPLPTTLQIGSPAIIAAMCGCTVVSDFRAADLAVGGQGAPLVPLVDELLLRSGDTRRVALNIGGIANITHLPRSGDESPVQAFDTGPGNILIDQVVSRLTGGDQSFDRGGSLASAGKVNDAVLRELLDHPFLREKPPKSTGREEFGADLTDRILERAKGERMGAEDVVATLTLFSARTIARAIKLLPDVDEIVVSGGGVHNPVLMAHLRDELGGITLRSSDELGIPPDSKEALAFALLAYLTLMGLPGNLPAATGAAHQVVLGSITPGANFVELMGKLWS